MYRHVPASLVLACAATGGVHAQSHPSSPDRPAAAAPAPAGTEIETLRRELGALRADYDSRLRALEQRLRAAEAQAAAPVAASAGAATSAGAPPADAGTATAALPPAANPPGASAAATANAFNPAISLILSGGYTHTRQDPATWRIAGFPLPAEGEVGPGERGFTLGESELNLSASIDPFWRGALTLAVHDEVEVEEAYVQTTALGQGLTLQAGRFLSGIGYLNGKHAHTWDFLDSPLAYQALLGGQYGDDGLRLTWLAPTEQYLEFGLEAARGGHFPAGMGDRHGAGMLAATVHTGGDWGDSHQWRAGLSWLQARADGLALAGTGADGSDLAAAFSGRTRLWIADAVWKWAPQGNATRQAFTLQGEYLDSRRSGTLTPEEGDPAAWHSAQSGWYVQGVYQFLPGWRAGLRTERLDAGTSGGLYALSGHAPTRHSLVLEHATSEFARLRLQLAQDRSRPGASDTQVMLQYQMSLGAHGAHAF